MILTAIAVAVVSSTAYQGVEVALLRRYINRDFIDDVAARKYPEDWEYELKQHRAYSPESFPLYKHLLTSDPPPLPRNDLPADIQERIKHEWVRLRWAAMSFVAGAEGDRSQFVPIGIDLLSDPSYRKAASDMLAKIAKKNDLPAIRKLVDLEDPKKLGCTVDVLMLLAQIGEEEDWGLLHRAVEAKVIRSDPESLRLVTNAREWIDDRFATKAKPKPDKK